MLVSYLDNVKKTHKTSIYSNVFVTRPFIIWSPRLKSKALSFWQILKLFALPLLFFSLTNGWHPFWGIIKKTRQMTAGISLELVVKFRYSEKAKKFEKISQFFWRYLAALKTAGDFWEILWSSKNISTLLKSHNFLKRELVYEILFFYLYVPFQ